MSLYVAPPPSAIAIELEIPFHDVDALQVVWHGHYCKYLELGRTVLLRKLRLDAPDLIELGYRFMVAETHLRHVFALRYGDRCRVSSWVTEIENRIRIQYDVHNATQGCRAARGMTLLITTRADGTLCYETPPPIVDRLQRAMTSAREGRP
ncbi:acyl-CoA thioesterase [Anaeromyxobacter oryzisoli]|uniref:acyl-CoA thioesterase n=1 Tax=Anaeromyxobacter oryzisoli TaxID=2925408 RepID=UPI001F593874|nr:acyl-CoA thioesterase [Anaeromyxobacter sp. SG63]